MSVLREPAQANWMQGEKGHAHMIQGGLVPRNSVSTENPEQVYVEIWNGSEKFGEALVSQAVPLSPVMWPLQVRALDQKGIMLMYLM